MQKKTSLHALGKVAVCAASLFAAAPASAVAATDANLYSAFGRYDENAVLLESFTQTAPTGGTGFALSWANYQARARTEHGVNKAYASASELPGGVAVDSIWSDRISAVGATSIQYTLAFNGTRSDGGSGEYDLVVYRSALTPAQLLHWVEVNGNTDAARNVGGEDLDACSARPPLDMSELGEGSESLVFQNLGGECPISTHSSGIIDLNAGESLYLASILSVGVEGSGIADFEHSAHVSLSVLSGGITTASGSTYANANAVAEPGTVLLMMSGLGLLGARGRKKQRAG